MIAQNDIVSSIVEKRTRAIEIMDKDPYMGFSSLDQAFEDCKFTSQAEVLARLLRRENLFISGIAGSGKTTVINRFVDFIDAEFYGEFTVAVTASTGIAATLIGGRTIHSWAGLGISVDEFDPENIDSRMKMCAKKFREVDVLIIDEISMLPAYLLTKLDLALKYFRKNDEPFGGVQVVFIGDFLQLPPVSRQGDTHDTRFAIETDAWKNANLRYCFLDKSYRANDERLKKILEEIAHDRVSKETKEIIKSRMKIESRKPNCAYTTLFTTNRNVDKYNEEQLNLSKEKSVYLKCVKDFGTAEDVKKVKSLYGIPEEIELKTGATVILTKNITLFETKLANGSLGVVVGFTAGAPLVRFNDGNSYLIRPQPYVLTKKTKTNLPNGKVGTYDEEIAQVSQTPLKLGYAITVHKSQGQTFDGVVMDLKNCFQEGLGYVALSRVRSIDDLVIEGFNEKAYKVSEKAKKITIFVKKKALKERELFLEDRETYEDLLTNNFSRMLEWNVTETSAKLFEKRKNEEDSAKQWTVS